MTLGRNRDPALVESEVEVVSVLPICSGPEIAKPSLLCSGRSLTSSLTPGTLLRKCFSACLLFILLYLPSCSTHPTLFLNLHLTSLAGNGHHRGRALSILPNILFAKGAQENLPAAGRKKGMKSPEGTLACDQDSGMHRPQTGLCFQMKGFGLVSCWGEDRPALSVEREQG